MVDQIAEAKRLDGGHALPLEQPAALGGVIASFAASFATRHG